jgi:hypothetical protein
MKDMTLESLQEIMPKNLKSSVTQDFVDKINNLNSSPEVASLMRENMLRYTSSLSDGKYNLQTYLDAIRYVTFKVMGDKNREAYIKTFPDRFQNMVDNHWLDKDINSNISAYARGKLVSGILEKTFMPMHVLGRDLHLEALEKNADLMRNARSETVQQKASATILEYTKAPEESKIEIDMSIKATDDINERYENALRMAAQTQIKRIEDGADITATANIPLNIDKDDFIEDAEVEAETETNE